MRGSCGSFCAWGELLDALKFSNVVYVLLDFICCPRRHADNIFSRLAAYSSVAPKDDESKAWRGSKVHSGGRLQQSKALLCMSNNQLNVAAHVFNYSLYNLVLCIVEHRPPQHQWSSPKCSRLTIKRLGRRM